MLPGRWQEKNFQSVMTHDNLFCLKLPDYSSFINVDCPRCKFRFRSRYQAPKAISDFLLFRQNEYAFVEIKSCKNSASYIFRHGEDYMIREHQMTYGIWFNQIGGRYFFALYRGKEEIFLVNPAVLKNLMEIHKDKTRIKWDIIRENAILSLSIGARPKIFDVKKMTEAIFDGKR